MALSSSTPCLRVLEAETTHRWITFTVVLLSLSQPLDLFLRTTWGWANPTCSAISPSAALPPLSMCVIQSDKRKSLPKHGWKDCWDRKTSLSSSFRALMILLSFWLFDRCPNDKWLHWASFEAFESTSFCSAPDFSIYPSSAGKSKTKRKHFRKPKRTNFGDMPFLLLNWVEITCWKLL